MKIVATTGTFENGLDKIRMQLLKSGGALVDIIPADLVGDGFGTAWKFDDPGVNERVVYEYQKLDPGHVYVIRIGRASKQDPKVTYVKLRSLGIAGNFVGYENEDKTLEQWCIMPLSAQWRPQAFKSRELTLSDLVTPLRSSIIFGDRHFDAAYLFTTAEDRIAEEWGWLPSLVGDTLINSIDLNAQASIIRESAKEAGWVLAETDTVVDAIVEQLED